MGGYSRIAVLHILAKLVEGYSVRTLPPTLQNLDLSGNPSLNAMALANLPPSLMSLNLQNSAPIPFSSLQSLIQPTLLNVQVSCPSGGTAAAPSQFFLQGQLLNFLTSLSNGTTSLNLSSQLSFLNTCSANEIGTQVLLGQLPRFFSLRTLNLTSNAMGSTFNANTLSKALLFPSLTSLDISGNPLAFNGSQGLPPSLQSLNLDQTCTTYGCLSLPTQWPSNFQDLGLSGSIFCYGEGTDDSHCVQILPWPSSLESLDLSGTNIFQVQVFDAISNNGYPLSVPSFASLTRLTSLNLKGAGVLDAQSSEGQDVLQSIARFLPAHLRSFTLDGLQNVAWKNPGQLPGEVSPMAKLFMTSVVETLAPVCGSQICYANFDPPVPAWRYNTTLNPGATSAASSLRPWGLSLFQALHQATQQVTLWPQRTARLLLPESAPRVSQETSASASAAEGRFNGQSKSDDCGQWTLSPGKAFSDKDSIKTPHDVTAHPSLVGVAGLVLLSKGVYDLGTATMAAFFDVGRNFCHLVGEKMGWRTSAVPQIDLLARDRKIAKIQALWNTLQAKALTPDYRDTDWAWWLERFDDNLGFLLRSPKHLTLAALKQRLKELHAFAADWQAFEQGLPAFRSLTS